MTTPTATDTTSSVVTRHIPPPLLIPADVRHLLTQYPSAGGTPQQRLTALRDTLASLTADIPPHPTATTTLTPTARTAVAAIAAEALAWLTTDTDSHTNRIDLPTPTTCGLRDCDLTTTSGQAHCCGACINAWA